MAVYCLDPLADPRWNELVERHPEAGVFHTRPWLASLRAVYGYEPIAYTTAPAGRLLDSGMVFCRVKSRLTGHRLVSLPFSDHCQPLVDDPVVLAELLAALRQEASSGRWDYLEWRPLLEATNPPASESEQWHSRDAWVHRLDLTPEEDALWSQCHNTAIRQAVRRAEREGVEVERGRDERLLSEFYHLLLLTRRKHKLPPPPRSWFRTVLSQLGEQAEIRVARLGATPIASVITLSHRERHYYKYSCFDLEYRNYGGTQHLLWDAIVAARRRGARGSTWVSPTWTTSLNLQDRRGAAQHRSCHPPTREVLYSDGGWKMNLARNVFSYLPDRLLVMAKLSLPTHWMTPSMTTVATSRALIDLFRCPAAFAMVRPQAGLSSEAGFFRFGEDVIGWGRTTEGAVAGTDRA
ncbi:GNAT family N-acetyltransferase [bacterium]|nr:GNAT family N-acetyltransferase [bacterium]